MASEMAQPGFWARVQRASVERLHIRLESLRGAGGAQRRHGGAVALLPVAQQFPQHPAGDVDDRRAGDRRHLRHRLGRARPVARLGDGAGRRRRRLRRRQSRLAFGVRGRRLHPRRWHCRLHQRPARHPRLRAGLHRHARHAWPGARPGAGHLARAGRSTACRPRWSISARAVRSAFRCRSSCWC